MDQATKDKMDEAAGQAAAEWVRMWKKMTPAQREGAQMVLDWVKANITAGYKRMFGPLIWRPK